MRPPQEQPLHWDSHQGRYNITLIVALVVAVVGLIRWKAGEDPTLAILGIGFAIYSWLTSPKQYLIYPTSLVIVYGRPRIKAFPFSEISHTDALTSPMGERLRVRLVNGRRIMLLARNPSEFRQRLDQALEKFRGAYPGREAAGEGQDRPSPY